MANCYACKVEIVFDNEHIGKNGKKIPLDPSTKMPHDCPMREKRTVSTAQQGELVHGRYDDEDDKDDHGNEDVFDNTYGKLGNLKEDLPKQEFVDHTVARPSKVKIFHAENSDLVELAYNEFLKSKTFQWTRAQLGSKGNEFAIALYYEEVTV